MPINLGLSMLLLLVSMQALEAETLISLTTRPNVEQRFILVEPNRVKGVVVLFVGGHGALNLSLSTTLKRLKWGRKNFLIRSHELFLDHQLAVAIVDAPTDQQTSVGMIGGFRATSNHVFDLDRVVRYLRDQFQVPVWLVGTSRGTESATMLALYSKESPDGLILTSSMSVANTKGLAVTEMPLEKIQIPTLIVGHWDDGCNKAPPEGVQKIKDRLINAKNVGVKMFRGGNRPESHPCRALSYHGFYGIEESVVASIAQFIRAN